ncbi:NAD(P)H-dependent flavin oxidoreductase [Amycolatopsis saalfeldensis]|uniref:Enoyl-[acyl-carrier protein] reductase II n=1 Tax=Amycolatopsis saalfeldensis TaxID=394193 RepID=A0A1H8YBA0_9PSEU|nr:nitronate monooxygenase family protein [Amycolatopsis saalfeldensis]SEP48738.1 enoyl-[acyl-carrier protein] reductase II [Amycolatopsis saalfeldensis]
MSPIVNRYTRLVGVEHPIVQEGLGPFRTPKLAAAVSEAGGLGTVSMPGMPEDIAQGARTFRAHIEECASLTDRPFAVNIPVGVDSSGKVLPFTDVYIRTALEAREAEPEIARRLRVVTTSAGFPGSYVAAIKDAGLVHQHKVGSTRQAVKAAAAGVDVVIAAGFEMGGHAPSKAVHTFVLIPNVTEAVDVPVLLTGGARDGRGLAAALALGAEGVAMGTRFITSTANSDWHPAYIQALLDAEEGDDVAFDGVYGPCRGLRNSASRRLAEAAGHRGGAGEMGQVELTRWKIESMQRAQTEGDVTDSLVLTGQVAAAIRDLVDVAEFVPRMAAEAAGILRSLAARLGSVAS